MEDKISNLSGWESETILDYLKDIVRLSPKCKEFSEDLEILERNGRDAHGLQEKFGDRDPRTISQRKQLAYLESAMEEKYFDSQGS